MGQGPDLRREGTGEAGRMTGIIVPSWWRVKSRLYSKKEIKNAYIAAYLYVLP